MQGRGSRLLKDKTHRLTTPSGIFSRICFYTHHGAQVWLALGKNGFPTVWSDGEFCLWVIWGSLQALITPKDFFRLNKSLHVFETHCAFVPLFNPNIGLLQAVKVTKSGHHHTTEQVRGMSLLLVWRHKLLCMHVYKDLIRCKSVCDIKQGIDPCPLLAWSCDRWWLDFVTFTT